MDNVVKILQKINILVVDDMEAMRSMVNGCLRELGAPSIMMEPNGKCAWALLQKKRIDLIVCDWDMPQMTGLELLKLVRESDKHKHIPFLMLTAATEGERVRSAVEAGVNDYLSKPFQPKALEYRVVKLLRKVQLK